ncbi:MAG: 4Fe-4S double cluster binding domain-containing protein, partial [Clostridiales bacterium]|nr:4Fe-4S double cluster binding domain-containing protein [Clostridiales bacterium]
EAGFTRVIVLNGAECGYPEAASVLLALWPYAAERSPATRDAWIHPYYYASQRAYHAADDLAKAHAAEGVRWRDDVLVKPIFARLPGFTQGRNTLSYTEEYGSRFHVQMLTTDTPLPSTHHLEGEAHPLHCGDCHKCEAACPTNALEGGVFHRERCLRNWQVSGQIYPEEVKRKMGNRLIGCDNCQRCCPHNPPPEGASHPIPVPLEDILDHPKQAAIALRDHIGATITMFNRLLGGACIVAGCTGRIDLLPRLEELTESPSEAVANHAQWAVNQLKTTHQA